VAVSTNEIHVDSFFWWDLRFLCWLAHAIGQCTEFG